MTQTATTTASAANLFAAAATLPNPVCVTAFIAPQSLIELSLYADGTKAVAEGEAVAPAVISVGTYMSDRSIWHICNFTNAANALNYAFMLKGENCPISKNAMALIQAEIKRTGAISTRAKARQEAKAKAKAEQEAKEKAEAEEAAKPKQIVEAITAAPLIEQYQEMKKKHPDAVLLFRCGDFYECFGDDAKTASDVLGITLTTRANGSAEKIYLAGFPHHALDTYLPKLVRAGHRVAICEQLDEPKVKKTKRTKKA
nr:hypothetical protein [Bacteroides acidifaciens]